GLVVFLLPLWRALARQVCANESWWGTPAVLFGAGPATQRLVSALLAEPGLGIRPVAVVDDAADERGAIQGVPVMSGFEAAAAFAGSTPFPYAVVAATGVPNSRLLSRIERYGLTFSRVLVIPDLPEFAIEGGTPTAVGGMLGLELCQGAFIPERLWPKRALDLTLTLCSAIVVLPLIGLLALWIKLDSRGPVFYGQRRIGKGGK